MPNVNCPIKNVCMVPGEVEGVILRIHSQAMDKVFIKNTPLLVNELSELLTIVIEELDADIARAQDADLKEVLDSYRNIILDPTVTSHIETLIAFGHDLRESIIILFEGIMTDISSNSTHLKDRVCDFEDVFRRLIQVCTGVSRDIISLDNDVVIVTEDISPTDLVYISGANVLGIVTAFGSRTSHIVEIATNMNIPCYIQAGTEILKKKSGDKITLLGDLVFV
jgi:phosphotransferase system enzyme I (PtsI)